MSRSPQEEEVRFTLARLWRQYLRLSPGLPLAGQGFLELGGDSLTTVLIRETLVKEYGTSIPIRLLLVGKTFEETVRAVYLHLKGDLDR